MTTPSDLNYRIIPLTKGKSVIVDADDYEWLSQWKWTAQYSIQTFYAMRSQTISPGKKVRIQMHRLILGLTHGDGKFGDHCNGNGLDNRRANLRVCTKTENMRNQRLRKDSSSGLKGVSFNRKNKNWKAYIFVDGKQIHLGSYKNPEEAYSAYCEAAKVHFGEFSRLL